MLVPRDASRCMLVRVPTRPTALLSVHLMLGVSTLRSLRRLTPLPHPQRESRGPQPESAHAPVHVHVRVDFYVQEHAHAHAQLHAVMTFGARKTPTRDIT